MKPITRPGRRHVTLAVVGFATLLFPVSVSAQRDRGGSNDTQRRENPQQRSNNTPQRQSPQQPVAHARREVVRTDRAAPPPRIAPTPPVRDIIPRRDQTNPTQGQRPQTNTPPVRTNPNQGQRPETNAPPVRANPTQPSNPTGAGSRTGTTIGRAHVQTPARVPERNFTRTQEGRRYDNGVQLRTGRAVDQDWQRPYFPKGRYHFPYYSPSYVSASVFISPFGFFFGVNAPFISRDHCYRIPSVVVYVDIPIYDGDVCRGFTPISDENYLNRGDLLDREPGLANAVEELRECFRGGNIDALVALTDPNIKIAIFLRGQYSYSLDPNDFVDLTRDALQSTETVEFDLTRIHRRADGVFVVSGEHVYRNRDGQIRRVYVSYVVEDLHAVWTLTEVETAPDRVQQWR